MMAWNQVQLFVVVVLLWATITAQVSSAAPTVGLDAFLLRQSQVDPIASNDTFLLLSQPLKKSLLSLPLPSPISHASLLSFTMSVPVHVVLVGSFPSDSSRLLSSFLSASLSSDLFHIISSGSSSSPHHLSLRHSLHLDSSSSPPSSPLASRLSDAIRSHLASSPSSLLSSLHSVPSSLVDSIIGQDFDSRQPSHSVHIYLLNLGPQPKPYAYSYSSSPDSSPAFTRCSGTLLASRRRYLWIDLSAGPVDYGPALSGDGLLPRGEFHPLSSLHGRPKSQKTVLADVASIVHSAYRSLLVPSLRVPVYFETSLHIHFVHIRGPDSHDARGLDWTSIQNTFLDAGLVFPSSQSLKFTTFDLPISTCPICSFAVSRSTNSFSSRFLFENYTLIVSEYLDSKRMHQILSDSADLIRSAARIPDEDDIGTVLPVYVFDLDVNNLLLLDRYHQAVAFRDMVIALRTRSTQTVSDYSCNGRHVITQTRELERPLVGSILQSLWGVTPTHMIWSPQHNSTIIDYTWSVGLTPFGPFSESSSLSFVQTDAAKRNVLLTSFNYTITSGIDVLDSVAFHGGDRWLLRQNRHVEFVQRWNLFKYKLDKAISAMSHLDYDTALYFLKSSDHDLFAIHTLVYQATQELEASLFCFKDPPFPWTAASITGVLLLLFIYVYAKRDRIFRNKRKQF